MTFKEALKQCRKVGTAHAEGDALRAMYAEMISFRHVLNNPAKVYAHLQTVAGDKHAITERATRLMRDPVAALDVVLA